VLVGYLDTRQGIRRANMTTPSAPEVPGPKPLDVDHVRPMISGTICGGRFWTRMLGRCAIP